jgi:hypothetical protein
METIDWLNNWYSSNCNGDWEHSYGVKIDTLDNPGWWLRIDLVDTPLHGHKLNVKEVVTATNWYNISCNGIKFEAFGDTTKLGLLIDLFRRFVEDTPADLNE